MLPEKPPSNLFGVYMKVQYVRLWSDNSADRKFFHCMPIYSLENLAVFCCEFNFHKSSIAIWDKDTLLNFDFGFSLFLRLVVSIMCFLFMLNSAPHSRSPSALYAILLNRDIKNIEWFHLLPLHKVPPGKLLTRSFILTTDMRGAHEGDIFSHRQQFLPFQSQDTPQFEVRNRSVKKI